MSFLKNLFTGKTDKPEFPAMTDYSGVRCDIHSHLIPGIDDGVKTIEESVEMIRHFYDFGFRKLVTTPHVMSDHYKNTSGIISEGLDRVRHAVAHEGIDIELEAAAEYYIDEFFREKIKNEKLLMIGGKYLLFEISYMNLPDNLSEVIFEMNLKGYKPLLAHPERYPFWYSKFEEYHKLKEQGVLFQVNTGSIAGYYGLPAKKIAERMIDENLIDFIGSDLHGIRHVQAMQHALSDKYLWKLVSQGVKNSSL
ncbi:MAG: capsular biosynthesis protein [Bacteroidetes bacterium]|nr:capsular biosynthesis protein [Bacteroidota bacterium]